MEQIFEYIKIAMKNLQRSKVRSILTMLGIIIGISSVILIISVGNGVKGEVGDALNQIAGGQIYLYTDGKTSGGERVYFNEDDLEILTEKIPHVKGASSEWNFYGANIITGKGNFDAYLYGGSEAMVYGFTEPFLYGGFFTKEDYDAGRMVCVLTEKSARKMFGTTNVVGLSFDLDLYGEVRELTIVGVKADNPSQMVNMLNGTERLELYLPLTALNAFGYYVNDYDSILVYGEGPEYSKEIASEAIKLLEAKYGIRGENMIQIQDFNDTMGEINSVLNYLTLFVSFVAAISLLVGGIGVMNIMLVSVTERTREIGIRRALGARTSSIMLQFLSESAMITLTGGCIGIVLGLAGAMGICSLLGFHAGIDPLVVVVTTIFSTTVGIFFGLYPAKKAAKLSPIEALRFLN